VILLPDDEFDIRSPDPKLTSCGHAGMRCDQLIDALRHLHFGEVAALGERDQPSPGDHFGEALGIGGGRLVGTDLPGRIIS
jgi:hypothetical protein